LWENEVFSTLKQVHEQWAHYLKDQGKFRVKIEERFFFPQLSELTRAFILACEDCQKEKAGRAERTDREMNPTPPVSPYFRVHLDLSCGPFRDQNNKKKYVAVCMDAMTKYASAKILPNKRAATVAAALKEEVLLRHGCPFEIVIDQGSEFREDFEKLLKKEGLKHVRIRARNPKANGQVERCMQILKSTLRIMCENKPRDWQRHVSAVIFQYNVTYQETIKMSPFMCLYGRLPIIHADHLFKSYRSSFADSDITLDTQLERLKKLEHLQRQSKLLIEQAQVKEKENYARWNRKHKPRSDPLNIGDEVIVQAPGTIRGFRLHWTGPYVLEGLPGPPENQMAIVRDPKSEKCWHKHSTEIVKFTSMQEFREKYIDPLQETAEPGDINNDLTEPPEKLNESRLQNELRKENETPRETRPKRNQNETQPSLALDLTRERSLLGITHLNPMQESSLLQKTLTKKREDSVYWNPKSSLNETQLEKSLSRFQKSRTEPFLQPIRRLVERVDHLDLRPRPVGNYLSTLLTSLPEKALLKVLFHLSTEDVLNLSQTCQAHHVLVHGLKCLHFAAYLASQKESLWIKLKLLLNVARISPRDIIKATNISALLHYTVAISYLRALPEKSTIFLKLKIQLQKHIPNGPLFKQALQISTELLDPAWESYANWFLTLGAEGTRRPELLNRLEIRTIVPSLEQSLYEERPYSLIVHFVLCFQACKED
jgi:transposase InsO family protein